MSSMNKQDCGFALITTLLMLATLSMLLAAYLTVTRVELATMRASKDMSQGFYAAEGGLNVRAEEVRATFSGYNVPTGTSPSTTSPCEGSNTGSGDFVCKTYNIGKRAVKTYLLDHQAGTSPSMIKIPQGELYQNLNAQEYLYTANSEAHGRSQKVEALLQLKFKSRLVPMFQFAAFYNKDLEINPGAKMTISGPIHTNGDLYLDANTSDASGLSINGQVTVSGSIYRGRKDNSNGNGSCKSYHNRIKDPVNYRDLIPTCAGRVHVSKSDTTPFNGMVQFGVPVLTVPEPENLDPTPDHEYWDHADLRLVLNLTSANVPDTTTVSTGIEVRNADDSVNASASTVLRACTGSIRRNTPASDTTLSAVGTSYSFYNNREGKTIRMLDIDIKALLNCLHSSNWFDTGKAISDATDGGLVLFMTVKGPNSSSTASPYGVRIRNGAALKSTNSGAPAVKGLTMVSDQAVYLQGDFNTTTWRPAAVLSDSFNVLSNYWYNSTTQDFRDSTSTGNVNGREATTTTQYVAILSGTDSTGGSEGPPGQDKDYNGGLENYPRFHEDWGKLPATYKYRGSFVSLNNPRRVNGTWKYGNPQYTAPTRDWDYDPAFNNAANLPPITPRFVYLRQELFVRDFEQ